MSIDEEEKLAIKSEKFKTWLREIANKLDVEDTVSYICANTTLQVIVRKNKFKVNTMKTRTRLISTIFTQIRLTLNLGSLFCTRWTISSADAFSEPCQSDGWIYLSRYIMA